MKSNSFVRFRLEALLVLMLTACQGSKPLPDQPTSQDDIKAQETGEHCANPSGQKNFSFSNFNTVNSEQISSKMSNADLTRLLAEKQISTGLYIPSLENSVLEMDFNDLEIYLIEKQKFKGKNKTTIKHKVANISYFDYFRIASTHSPDNWIEVSQYFTKANNGALIVSDVNGFRQALETLPKGKLNFSIYAESTRGKTFSDSVEFFLGQHQLYGRLCAPPSNPNLILSGLKIKAQYLSGEIPYTLEKTSNTMGEFQMDNMVPGTWALNVSTKDGNTVFSSLAAVSVDNNKQMSMNLLNATELQQKLKKNKGNYSAYYHLTDMISDSVLINQKNYSSKQNSVEISAKRQVLHDLKQISNSTNNNNKDSLTSPTTIFISTEGGNENTARTVSQTLTVPAGTRTVTLSYKVQSNESPNYLSAHQSYGDIWQISVLATNSTPLFSTAYPINAQVKAKPVWQSDNSTGNIVQTIDVSALTLTDTEITLVGSTANIGDNLLPTKVEASLSLNPEFNIQSITNNAPLDIISIPKAGKYNKRKRSFKLKLVKPSDAVIRNVSAVLVDDTGRESIMTVVDAPITNKNIRLNNDTLDVIVTMDKQSPSIMDNSPLNVSGIRYRFTVEAIRNGQFIKTEKESEIIHPLWPIPANVRRFGGRDSGGDGWVARGTYHWLEANSKLVARVNDVSGEHGRNIGHLTHKKGTDIDIYHFTDLTNGKVNGNVNYLLLKRTVENALQGNSQSVSTVTNWVLTARRHLDELTEQKEVNEVIYGRGFRSSRLPSAWIRKLMETGQLQYRNKFINLELGNWKNDKVIYRNDHNNHSHINLHDNVLKQTYSVKNAIESNALVLKHNK